MEVTGRDPPEGVNSFQDATLHSICDLNIKRTGYDVPTPIQKRALPIILKGRDVMACAQTGSGKTVTNIIFPEKLLLYVTAAHKYVVELVSFCIICFNPF